MPENTICGITRIYETGPGTRFFFYLWLKRIV